MPINKNITEGTKRVNTRILLSQHDFIKEEVSRLNSTKKKGEKEVSEGDIHREITALGIEVYKNKSKKK